MATRLPGEGMGQRVWWLVTKETVRGKYAGDFVKTTSIRRFLALTGIYYDFLRLAWGVNRLACFDEWAMRLDLDTVEFSDWDEADGLDSFRNGRWEEWGRSTDAERFTRWTAPERSAIRNALLEHHRGAKGVLAALWRTGPLELQGTLRPGGSPEWVPSAPLTDEEFQARVLPSLGEALAWVIGGCKPMSHLESPACVPGDLEGKKHRYRKLSFLQKPWQR